MERAATGLPEATNIQTNAQVSEVQEDSTTYKQPGKQKFKCVEHIPLCRPTRPRVGGRELRRIRPLKKA